ncbi:MAG: secretin N-terminal domain-containing protein [Rhodocyclaceae bacterium]|nr:secretin N-terminal domain-containing protein [Rhodocyclaceae bacterium]
MKPTPFLPVISGWRRLAHLALSFALAGLLAACVTNPSLDKARQQIAEGDAEGGLATLQQGMKAQPQDQELRASYLREKDRFVARLVMEAETARLGGRWNEATAGFERVLRLDPGNARAASGKGRIALDRRHQTLMGEALEFVQKGEPAAAEARLHAILMENPQQSAARGLLRRIQEKSLAAEALPPTLKGALTQTITLEFRDASLKSVFEVIARTSGINFVFDRDVRGETPVTLFVRETRIEEVMKLLLVTNQLERKVLNENTVLIYPNTPVKTKDYQELVVRSFYLRNAEVKQAMALIKTMVKTRDVFADEKLNLLVMRDTPDAVRMAEHLIEGLDLAEPEVMLEVEVLEVARNKLQNLGVQWPDQVGYGKLTPDIVNQTVTATGSGTSTTLGGALAAGYTNLHGSLGVPFVANPAFMLNLHDGVDNADILANPRIRVKNKEKAKIHIGERLPVFTTTSTANVGVSASVNYLDVGLKLDVEPLVGLDDEVSIKVGLEVSSVIKEVTGPQSALAYEVGTRTAATTLRLRDGETQVLAGLINDEERSSAVRLPGVGDIPLVGRLFGAKKDSHNKTEIVLLITPHVVRNVVPPDAATVNFPGGTDASVGTPPLRLAPGKPNALAVSYGGVRAPEPTAEAPARPAADRPVLPVVAPENGSPQAGNPSSAQPIAEGQAKVQFQVPAKAVAGQDLVLGLTVTGLAGLTGGRVEVAYDPTAVEIPGGAADGRLVFSLASGPGGSLRGEGRVRVIPGAGKEVAFQVVSVQVEDGSGNRTAVSAPPPSLVKIGP